MSEYLTPHDGIVVFVPTRERPDAAFAAYTSFKATRHLANTTIIFGLDYDEPYIEDYKELIPNALLYSCDEEGSGSLSKVLNTMSRAFPARIQGMVNDDHRFRTPGWDIEIRAALLSGTGVAYGNDLLMGEWLPTSVFLTGNIPEALGWFALPDVKHMYLDNSWKDIGHGLNSLHYLPNVVIEHLHYSAGKSPIDQSYVKTYGHMEPDKVAYERWRKQGGYAADIERINVYLRGLSEQEASIPPCEG